MALNFFKQIDIDMMDPNNIPEEFVNYFDSLSEERKAEIINSKPELAKGLGYIIPRLDNRSVGIDEKEAKIEEYQLDRQLEVDTQDDIFAQISNNLYEFKDLDEVLIDELDPVEALILPDKTENCPLHKSRLEKITIKYRRDGQVYGIMPKLCRKCKRLFLEESQAEYVHLGLMQRAVDHIFYDKELTKLYLDNQKLIYVLNDDEKIYVPDVWIEENPRCPIHGEELIEINCEKIYMERKVRFKGYFCKHCNKVLVRKAIAVNLIDECAIVGVPEIVYEILAKNKPERKIIKSREIRPDYFVQDGKREVYNYKYTANYYQLTENDTIVVSDSIYCVLDGHSTEEVLALIMVKEKKARRNAYLFMVGYCAQCQKYYMDEEDYKVIYKIGRPYVTVLFDDNNNHNDYQITSGEIFNLERKHLNSLECDINSEISDIHQKKDYVNPYAVGDYDDGGLFYAKSVSRDKYGSILEKLSSFISKPYSYRVDIGCDNTTKIYYVGPQDIVIGEKEHVISFNSDFGRELVNYQTRMIKKNNKEYDIKLSRRFDIDQAILYGYINLKTEEDKIFRSGITDPFLVRVLNMRKKQHNLIDIIATIQENQNKIVDADFSKNIIVQGCAGSGKTMVLLHRLSALQYKNQKFDFKNNALILTPNNRFSLHIKGLAEGLQIGSIERISVEQYYEEILLRYSKSFKLDEKLSPEISVKQEYVEYIYSDQFKTEFDRVYDIVISERNKIVEVLDYLTTLMGQPKRNFDFSNDAKVVQQFKNVLVLMNDKIRQQENDKIKITKRLKSIRHRKEFLEKEIKKLQQESTKMIQESLVTISKRIEKFLDEKRKTQSESEKDLSELNNSLFMMSLENKTEKEILEWMERIKFYIQDVEREIEICKTPITRSEKFYSELENEIPKKILEVQEELTKITNALYPKEAKQMIKDLSKKIESYSIINTFQMVFDQTVEKFKVENDIRTIKGKYHRYDLYARLLFALKYFKVCHGTTRFMCVDEGQDLAYNEYRLLSEVNSGNVIFNIFGDVNQLINSRRGISEWIDLKCEFDAYQYTLNENYRNTNQITRFCNSSFDMDVLRTGVDGAMVREIARKELEPELALLNIITERVAILVPRNVDKKEYLNLNILPSKIKSIIGDKIDNGYISLMYVDEVKGIEFDKVYVVGNTMTRNEKYIAYTRALSELIVVVDDTIKDREEIKRIEKNDLKKEQNTLHIKNLSYKYEAT